MILFDRNAECEKVFGQERATTDMAKVAKSCNSNVFHLVLFSTGFCNLRSVKSDRKMAKHIRKSLGAYVMFLTHLNAH